MKLGLLLFIFSVYFLPFKAAAADPIVFKMCYEDRELLPYFAGGGKTVPKEKPGVSIEVLQIFNVELPQLDLQFRREPWKRCLSMLEVGKISGVIGSYKKSRHKLGIYPMKGDFPDHDRAFELTKYCLYTKEKYKFTWNGDKFSGLPDLPVAIPLGYSILDLFQTHNIPVTEVNSSDRGFALLHHNRVSATATLCESGKQILAQQDFPNITVNHTPLRVKGSYLLISHQFYKAHTKLAERMWDHLVDVNKRYYADIYQKYQNK